MKSESPNQKQPQPEGSNRTSNEHDGQSEPQITPASRSAELHPPQSPNSHDIPYKTQRDWHDYTMLVVQGVGVFFLIAYTTFAALQWCEMKRTNKLTSDALELNRKLAIESQAAGFECRSEFTSNIDRPWAGSLTTVACPNRGKINAGNVTGEVIFTRINGRGQTVQNESVKINQSTVIPGSSAVNKLFAVKIPFDFKKYAQQKIMVKASLSYDNGLERTSQGYCWILLVSEVSRSFGFVSCENAEAAKQNQ